MEDFREKLSMIIAVIVAVAICVISLVFIENYDKTYYTQIDNSKIEKLSTSSDMKYEYTLDCYSDNGVKKEIKFKTSRELREDAYIKLEVRTFGVHSWEEVELDELPEKVKFMYK